MKMALKYLFSFMLMPLIIKGQDSPAPPAPSPAATGEQAPSLTSSFWNYLFSPSPAAPSPAAEAPGPTPPAGGTTPNPEEESMTEKALDYTGELAKDAVKGAAGMISPAGSQVTADQNFLEQAASYVNQVPGATADVNTVFGLYDVLSELVVPTPEGGVTMKVPTSDMLEKIKPWTDPYFDTAPLITALKGYEAYVKAKETVGNVKDKVEGAAGDVKDGVVDAANKVGDVGGEAVDKVKDFFGR